MNRPKSKSLLRNQEDYRKKVEERELLDLGQDIREKFGDERGWKMSLRYNENVKGAILEYSEGVGALH